MATKTTANIKCPLCGMNRVLHQKDFTARFGLLNPKSVDLIQIRDSTGGRTPDGKSHGFPIIDKLTIKEAISNPEYAELISQIYTFSKKYIKFIDSLKKK